MTKPTVIDLFAGCGGMTVGFAAEGLEPVLAVEWDRQAAATYAANWGDDHVIPGDIAAVAKKQIPLADLVIGGPPCQGFSNLGLKKLDDPRNQLWREYMRFIQTAKPQVFVIENVDRFSKSPEFEMLQAEADHGLLKNYELHWGVLNAADYGVSQRRRRTIVIGSRVGPINLPEPTHARAPEAGSGLKQWATVRDAIEGLPIRPESSELPNSVTEQSTMTSDPNVAKNLNRILDRLNPRYKASRLVTSALGKIAGFPAGGKAGSPGHRPTAPTKVRKPGAGSGGTEGLELVTAAPGGPVKAKEAQVRGGYPSFEWKEFEPENQKYLADYNPKDQGTGMDGQPSQGVVYLNNRHPVFVQEFQYWSNEVWPKADHAQVGELVRSEYGQEAVAHVVHAQRLNGTVVGRDGTGIPNRLGPEDIDELLTRPALSAAMLGLVNVEQRIQTKGGGLFGRKSNA